MPRGAFTCATVSIRLMTSIFPSPKSYAMKRSPSAPLKTIVTASGDAPFSFAV